MSQGVWDVLLGSRKGSTRKTYNLKWKRFASWCAGRKLDPFTCSVHKVLDYLFSLSEGGLQLLSVQVHLAAISAFHTRPGFFCTFFHNIHMFFKALLYERCEMESPAYHSLIEKVVSEKHSIESRVSVSHIQLACNSHYCAFPLNGNELCIWNTVTPLLQVLELVGHHQTITAVTFGHKLEPLLLCSASQDYIIIWDVIECRRKALQGLMPRGTVIGTLLGNVLYLSFSPDDQNVAVCCGNKIYLLNTEEEVILSVLEGHIGPVTAVEFCSWQINVLVSVSEDRTFKVWDSSSASLIYQSAVLSASPLLSLCIDDENKQLITGSGDGQLWTFSLLDGHQCHRVLYIELQKKLQKYCCEAQTRNRHSVDFTTSLPSSESDSKNDKIDIILPVLQIARCKQLSVLNEELNRSCCIEHSDSWLMCNRKYRH
ncbi:WD repeat-containing protein 27-like [Latimeria chalumnae]|uniref:WD repeat-containing protein 27-like n=1 Tax=Latimeria chalumnae TaxID=7897 RepID=UPI00313D2249